MINSTLERELHQHLEHLPFEQQRQVLEFARALAKVRARGVEGRQLLRFGGTIDSDDLDAMSRAIAQGCENVDANQW